MIKWSDLKKELYRPGEAAAILGVSPKTLTRYAKGGRIGSIGTETGRRLYPKEEVAAALARMGRLDDDRAASARDAVYVRELPGSEGRLDRDALDAVSEASGLSRPEVFRDRADAFEGPLPGFCALLAAVASGRAGRVFVGPGAGLPFLGREMLEALGAEVEGPGGGADPEREWQERKKRKEEERKGGDDAGDYREGEKGA